MYVICKRIKCIRREFITNSMLKTNLARSGWSSLLLRGFRSRAGPFYLTMVLGDSKDTYDLIYIPSELTTMLPLEGELIVETVQVFILLIIVEI